MRNLSVQITTNLVITVNISKTFTYLDICDKYKPTGQEQDSFGGGFQRDQSFSGEVTDLNIWSSVLASSTLSQVKLSTPLSISTLLLAFVMLVMLSYCLCFEVLKSERNECDF